MIRELVQRVSAPPRNYVGPPWLNRAGLQVGRVLAQQAARQLRPSRASAGGASAWIADLERDGIAVIPNFFAPDVFERVEAAYEAAPAELGLSHEPSFEGYNVDWTFGAFDPAHPVGKVVTDAFAARDDVRAAVEAVMGRRVGAQAPTPSYQRLVLPDGKADDVDPNGILHTDRFYDTVKVFLYVADVVEEDGPFVFCPGSHRLTLARLQHEYDFSVRETALTRGQEGYLPPGSVSRGRCLVSPELADAMGLVEQSYPAPKNTLMIVNTRGFHRRGTLQPGRERRMIRLVFHHLETPRVGRLLGRALSRFQ